MNEDDFREQVASASEPGTAVLCDRCRRPAEAAPRSLIHHRGESRPAARRRR